MIPKEKISHDINISTGSLLEELSGFTSEEFIMKPADGGWSAAEVLEHIIILESHILKLFVGNTEETIGREPEKRIGVIKSVFMNIERKLNSPAAIVPNSKIISHDTAIKKIRELRNKLTEFAFNDDLTVTCKDFKHHFFGELTKVEWIYFSIYHGERHLEQIRKLKAV